MLRLISRSAFRILGSLGLTLFLSGSCIRAGVIQDTATLPPANGAYGLHATSCLLAACIVESDIGNLMVTSSTIVDGNQLVTADGSVRADVFQNAGGAPGAQIGSLTLLGTLSITYLGRSSETELGTFNALLTSFDFMGSFNSHTLRTRLNFSQGGNSGITTISQEPVSELFLVDSFFDVFAELSLDGGPYVPGPERHVGLESTVPEPASAGLTLLSAIGLAALLRRTRRLRTLNPLRYAR